MMVGASGFRAGDSEESELSGHFLRDLLGTSTHFPNLQAIPG